MTFVHSERQKNHQRFRLQRAGNNEDSAKDIISYANLVGSSIGCHRVQVLLV